MELKQKQAWLDKAGYHVPEVKVCGNCSHFRDGYCFHPDIHTQEDEHVNAQLLSVSPNCVCDKHNFYWDK